MKINLNEEIENERKVSDAQAKYIKDLLKQNNIPDIFQHSKKVNGRIVYTNYINRMISKNTGTSLIKALINKEDIIFEFNGSTDIIKKDLKQYALERHLDFNFLRDYKEIKL